MSEKERRTFSLDTVVFNKIQQMAKKDNRSTSMYVNLILKKHVEKFIPVRRKANGG